MDLEELGPLQKRGRVARTGTPAPPLRPTVAPTNGRSAVTPIPQSDLAPPATRVGPYGYMNPYGPPGRGGPRMGNVGMTSVSTTTMPPRSQPNIAESGGQDSGVNRYPPAPQPRRSVMNAFGQPMREGVQMRAADLRAFERGEPLAPQAQFGNQRLAEALMRRRQIGQV